jgi:hypothetical protein
MNFLRVFLGLVAGIVGVSALPACSNQTLAMATLNDVPIVFYGKLEDQAGNPVVGAEITGSVQVYNGTRSGIHRFAATSDGDGLFQLRGGKGESMGVMPRKEGYVLASTNTGFNYSYFYPHSRHVPDQNTPVVIKMWKLKGAEPLVKIDRYFRIPFTDSPLHIDLLTGKVSNSGGDLKILMTRVPGPFSQQIPGEWSIEFKTVDGGLMESDFETARVTYEAPRDGYQDTYLVRMNPESRTWSDGVRKVFFVRSRGGLVYSKFSVDCGINSDPKDPVTIQFHGLANDHNSRNWEEPIK